MRVEIACAEGDTMRTRTATVLGSVIAALGVLLLAAAAVLYWVVLPSQAKLPADTDTTRQYDGTAKLLLNSVAVATGDFANAIIRDAPVTASRTVKVLATDGDAAQVSDSRVLKIATGGQTIGETEVKYAVDRKTLEAVDDPPADWDVVAHQGLTVSWPIGAEKHDYTGWVNETQITTPVRFVREETRGGINTYVYEATAPASPIKDTQVLAALPPALPGTALAALGQALPIPDEQKAQLARILPQLTAPVPLSYTYEATSTYWVAPDTGLVVDTQREEIRKASLDLGSAAPAVSVPIYDVQTGNTDESVTAAADEARSDGDKINLYGQTLPLILLVVGAIALIAGIVLIALNRGRRSPAIR
jgi:hypothetical protein